MLIRPIKLILIVMIYYKSQAEKAQSEDTQRNIGGLNKSHKMQRLANSIEAVYFQNALICMKSNRADNQRSERRAKR